MPVQVPPSSDDTFARRARILVCEDSPTTTKFLEWLLQPLYEVCMAPTGERAIAAAVEFLPDVVLCDLMLPGISGTEVFRRLRSHPAFEDVPFVIMTALDDEDGRTLGLEAGADDYLRKPFGERELLARVASLVRLRRVTQSLRAQNAALSRAAPGGGAQESDAGHERAGLEALRGRFTAAVCALEAPMDALSQGLAGVASALGSTSEKAPPSEGAAADPSVPREGALRSLDGAALAAGRLRALLDELEALLDGQEPACVPCAPRDRGALRDDAKVREGDHGDARVL